MARIDRKRLVDPRYRYAVMLPIFAKAIGRHAGKFASQVAQAEEGIRAVADFWQGQALPTGQSGNLASTALRVAHEVAASVFGNNVADLAVQEVLSPAHRSFRAPPRGMFWRGGRRG